MKNTVALVILDGFGIGEDKPFNAISNAKIPTIKRLLDTCPKTSIGASGLDVGLPEGQMGNSEVGHTNIGAGRIVYQSLTRITKSINDGDFFKNEALISAMENANKNNSALHIMGLLSDGGVHSHIEHLYGLLKFAKERNVERVYVHAFTDGRDVSPTSGINFIKELETKMKEIGVGKIATISGRYYAMDRDKRWDRLQKAYDLIVNGKGKMDKSAVSIIEKSYTEDITDEFIIPTGIEGFEPIKNNDSVIFFNFRPDRAREITSALTQENFDGFTREKGSLSINFVAMTEYDADFTGINIAFKPETLKNTLGEYLSNNSKTQLRIAETEKYAHVTFFFNGGEETEYKNEDRILVKSPDVATYDLKPEMSAYEVTEKVTSAIESGKYDVVILNYANCDMVGHTGVFEAAVKAVETVDICLDRLLKSIDKVNGTALITADHGNADVMEWEDGSPFTQHTTNPVPFIVYNHNCELRKAGVLADIAPTMLDILNMQKPMEMTGNSLILK